MKLWTGDERPLDREASSHAARESLDPRGLGALVLVAAVVVAALPAAIRWLAVNRWEALTGRPASIDRVEVRLRDGHFEFQGVRLADRAPGPPFIEIEREPVPEAAGRALSQGRLEASRRALIEVGGIEADRPEAAEGEAEVSASGAGRVELELAP